jgi:putative SOS response-associated peptidase YedK
MMPWADVVRLLGGDVRASVHGKPSWNIAPTHQIAIVENSPTGRHLVSARWGLAVPVSPRVNNPRNNDAECVTPTGPAIR